MSSEVAVICCGVYTSRSLHFSCL